MIIMNKKIKSKLRKLAIAFQGARYYDYCPNTDQTEDLLEKYLDKNVYNFNEVKAALDQYSGSTVDEVAHEIILIINEL